MEDKKIKFLILIIVILSILVLCLGGYIIYEKFFIKESNVNKNDNTTPTVENSENSDNGDDNIDNDEYEYYTNIYLDENIKDEEIRNAYALVYNLKSILTGGEWNFKIKNKLTFNDLDKDKKMGMVFVQLAQDKKVKFSYYSEEEPIMGPVYTFTKEDFKESWKKVYGNNNVEFVEKFIYNSCSVEIKNSDDYVASCTVEGREEEYDDYLVIDSNKTNDRITIDVAYYYSLAIPSDDLEYGVYYNKDAASNNQLICKEQQIQQNIDKLQQYRFTFLKQNDNFIFESIEKIN